MRPTRILLVVLIVTGSACGGARPYRLMAEEGYESLRPHLLR